jgi:hypothetical protein
MNRIEVEIKGYRMEMTFTIETKELNVEKLVEMTFNRLNEINRFETSLEFTITHITDPNQLDTLVSSLGQRHIQFLPFMIKIGDKITVPRDYDPVWI